MVLRISESREIHRRTDQTSVIRVNEITFMRLAITFRSSESKERLDGVPLLHHRCPFCMRKLLVHIFTTLLGIINFHELRLC